jgi:peroxiredoxin/predicted 2-oxoglutarate/Fe(II)-dependent dioxygenase YbiX
VDAVLRAALTQAIACHSATLYFHCLEIWCFMSALTVGDPAPWFTAASTSNPTYHFESVGGYRIILSFLGSSKLEASGQVLQRFAALQDQLAAHSLPFFGVTIDATDESLQNLVENPSFFKLIWDFDRAVSLKYGVCQVKDADQAAHYTPTTFVLNQNLRVVGIFPIEDPETHVEKVLECAKQLPVFGAPAIATRQAPALFIPNVLDPALCQHLIQLYEADGGRDSGFMRQVDGKTVEILDPGFKRRRDLLLEDPALLAHINSLILRRIKPEIEKAYQFSISRFERYLVSCYEASDQGFFNRHRDNTTKGTAHRRFAMTLNLNTGEYEGGCLWFPEYGTQLYRPEVGEAVIFSCSMLHEATPVTSGRRFALLSFFYNDDDAQVREQNQKYVVLRNSPEEQPDERLEKRDRPSPTKTTAGFQPKQRKKRR